MLRNDLIKDIFINIRNKNSFVDWRNKNSLVDRNTILIESVSGLSYTFGGLNNHK